MVMQVKLKFTPEMTLLELARFCGTAPCTILSANNCRRESDLAGREINVPINTAYMVRPITSLFIQIADKATEDLREVFNTYNVNLDGLRSGNITRLNSVGRTQHIVAPMETISTIARHYSISEQELIQFNDGTSHIFLGQKLYVPWKK
jgi:spore germination protein YaaH